MPLAERLNLSTTDAFDSTVALLREGYDFISNRCEDLHSDAFGTRLMLRPVICARGMRWAEAFYGGERFTRQGAMPPTTVRLLQDFGSVQLLDGVAHRRRKSLFVDLLMDRARVDDLAACFEAEWHQASKDWRGREISLLESSVGVLARAACRWVEYQPKLSRMALPVTSTP